MNHPSIPVDSNRDTPWVLAWGALVGVSMVSLSLTGLLGRLTPASVLSCLLLACAAAFVFLRGRRPSGLPHVVWMALPLVVPSAWAAWQLPPYTWDDVAYGAALPRGYAEAGRFFYNADYGAYSAFPANHETLTTASLVLTGGVSASQLLNVLLALGLGLVAVQLSRALGAAKAPSLVAGLLVLCAPTLIEVAPLSKNDVACALFQSLAVLALVECLERRGTFAAGLAGAFLGIALGVKYSTLHFVIAVAPFAVVLLVRSGERGKGLWRVLAWGGSLAVFASPWYVRNLVLFGNPLYPFLNDVLGVQNAFTREHSVLLRESFDGIREVCLKTGTPGTFVARVLAQFGALPTVLALPGLFLALRPANRRAGVLLAGTAVVYAALTFSVGYWVPRYFLSLLVLMSALATLPLAWVGTALRRLPSAPRRLAWLTLLAVPVVVAIGGASPSWRTQWRDGLQVRRQGRDAFVKERVRYLPVAEWLNAHMTPRDRVAIGFNIQPFYYLRGPYYHIHPQTEGALLAAETPDEVEAALRGVGATLLAFSGSDGTYYEDTAPQICAYRLRLWRGQRQLRKAGRLRLLAQVAGIRILRLEDGPGDSDSTR
jgi:4-amino-4-deoxy-L-arabinose transferase-like glycosyltransferase